MHEKFLASPKLLTYSAIAVALCVVLDTIKLFRMPMGGGVTLMSMLFIALVGYWFGATVGFVAGFAAGLIQLFLDPYIVHPIQFLMDYPLAYAVLGLSGIFATKGKYALQIGYAFGVFLRFFVASLSGYIFFKSFTPEGMNPIWYTVSYNGSYLGVEAVITLLIILIPSVSSALRHVASTAKNNRSS